MKPWTRALSAALLCLPALAHGADIVANPGFETPGEAGQPAAWHGDAGVYQQDTAVTHTGEASLRFENDNPDHYVICAQPLSLEAGAMYAVTAWVKTEGIQGEDTGATVCLEWYGPDRTYLGGCYPPGIKGDHDWFEVRGESPRVPSEAVSCTVGCYVRKGMAGTAWWDDVRVERIRETPLETVLLRPNYRGEVAGPKPRAARVRAVVRLRDYAPLALKDVELCWQVRQGETVLTGGRKHSLRNTRVDVAIPVAKLKPGAYTIHMQLVRKDDETTLAATAHRLTRIEEPLERPAYIDKDNRLMVNGAPFFPLGMYWGGVSEAELDIFADSPFNCLMPYHALNAEEMDACAARGIKVIYSVKDYYHGTQYCPPAIQSEADAEALVRDTVTRFKDHPALIAWYINDELPATMLPQLEARQALMETLDPGHPTWVVLYQVDHVAQYIRTFDVIGTDPYPIPTKPVATAAEWTAKTVKAVRKSRPVWQVPQVFNWANYKKDEAEKKECRAPTFAEMRSMVWQCIAEGATGIVCYSWFDIRRDPATPFDEHWPKVCAVAEEVKNLIPVLLANERPPRVHPPAAPWLSWLVRKHEGRVYLVAVNQTEETQECTFAFSDTPKRVVRQDTGEEKDAARILPITLDPLGVGIYMLEGL